MIGALIVYLAFAAALFAAGELLPGRVVDGTTLADGSKERYKTNGLLLLFITAVFQLGGHALGLFDGAYPATHVWSLFAAANIAAIALSTTLYFTGRKSTSSNASLKAHTTASPLHDFVVGVQLNPRLFGFLNIKFLCYRPAMIGWMVLNLAQLCRIHFHPSLAMVLYQLFSNAYIVDYFVHEPFMLSTWDIVAEHFGLMLVWGDLVFITFVFGLAGFVLAATPGYEIGAVHAMLCVALFIAGYAVFRGSNREKALFKADPQRAGWVTVGNGKLLASGWWGLARHINYLGDLLIAVSFALPAGLLSILSWVYPIYLTILLIHRERRDEHRCATKYGDVWKQYCKLVPYRIVPGVY